MANSEPIDRTGRGGGFGGWLPDLVTSVRIALAPVFLLVAEWARNAGAAGLPDRHLRFGAVAILAAIAASDKIDGYLARRSATGPTRHGAILDAVADRLVQYCGALFFALRAEPAFTPLPIWLPLALLAREAILLINWARSRPKRPNVEHELHGKVATVLVFTVLLSAGVSLPPAFVTPAATLAAAAVLYSAVRYAMRLR